MVRSVAMIRFQYARWAGFRKKLLGKDKLVFATRLLVNSGSGKKMSKSEGELIALSDSPQEMRRKVLMTDDSMIKTVFQLCTEKPQDWIDGKQKEMESGRNPKEWKEELSDEIVKMYHGEEGVSKSREPVVSDGAGTSVVSYISGWLSISKSEVKKLLEQGAVEVNGRLEKAGNTT